MVTLPSPRLPIRPVSVIAAGAAVLWASIALAAPTNRGFDCRYTDWPPTTTPDVFQLSLAATRDAAAGDGPAQWLLGSLYLFGLGVPKDRQTGITLIETATRTVTPVIRAANPSDPPSEMELFSMMFTVAEDALPELIRQLGAARGIASYKLQIKTLIQALAGCPLGK